MISSVRILDLASNPLAGKSLVFTSVNSPGFTVSGSLLGVADNVTKTLDASGSVTCSLLPTLYNVTLAKPEPETSFYITSSGNVVSASTVTGSSATVVFNTDYVDFDYFAVKKIQLSPQWSYPVFFSGSLIALAATSSKTDASGSITFNTVVPGVYLVEAFGKVTTSGYISVPATGGTLNASTLITVKPSKGVKVRISDVDNSFVLTVSASDARYEFKGQGGSGGSSVSASWASSSLNSVNAVTASQVNDGGTVLLRDGNLNVNDSFTVSPTLVEVSDVVTFNCYGVANFTTAVTNITTGSITGSLKGTASVAINAQTASNAPLYLKKVNDTATNPTLNFTSSGTVYAIVRPTANGLECYSPGADSNAFWTAEDAFHAGYIVTSAIEGDLTGNVTGTASYASFANSSSQAVSSSILTNGQSTVLPVDDTVRVIAGGASSFVFGDVGSTINSSVLPLSAPSITASLFGTASYAQTSSHVAGGVVSSSNVWVTGDIVLKPSSVPSETLIRSIAAIASGSHITIAAGDARAFINASYPGGTVNILGGSGSIGTSITNGGMGGNINIIGGYGSGSTGDNVSGGNIVIKGGTPFGTGSLGTIKLSGSLAEIQGNVYVTGSVAASGRLVSSEWIAPASNACNFGGTSAGATYFHASSAGLKCEAIVAPNSDLLTNLGSTALRWSYAFVNNISASNVSASAVTASLFGTASWTNTANSASYVVSNSSASVNSVLVATGSGQSVWKSQASPSYFLFRDDFVSGVLTDGAIGNGWRTYNVAGSSVNTLAAVAVADYTHPGQIKSTTAAAVGSGSFYQLAPGGVTVMPPVNLPGWSMYITFQLGQITGSKFFFGVANSLTPSEASRYVGLRYNTSASLADTDFLLVSRDSGTTNSASLGIVADTNWHTVRIWADTAGFIKGQIDTGSIVSIVNNANNGAKNCGFGIVSDTATAKNVTVDYVGLEYTTPSR